MSGLVPLLVIGLFGGIIGSFLNVCIYRVPIGKSVVSPPSSCPNCERRLSWYQNIPMLSYLALGGRCRGCRTPISARYPIVEATTAVFFAAAFWYYGPSLLLVSRLIFICLLIVLFAIDLELQLLPYIITLPAIVVGLGFGIVTEPGWLSALLGALIGYGILWTIAAAYFRLRHEQGLGEGDPPMLAMIGAFIGWKLTLVTLMMASFAGSIVGVGLIVFGRGHMKLALPFGTFLAIGAVLAATIGPGLLSGTCGYGEARMAMTPNAYGLFGLTVLVGGLAATLIFAMLRFVEAARQSRTRGRGGSDDNTILSAALQEAVTRLQARERATAARAEASERLSDQIIASLTAGLLVVGLDGTVRILNPAARRMLTISEPAPLKDFRVLLGEPALSELIDECLTTGTAILRRSIHLPHARGGASHLGVTVSPLSDGGGELHGAICLFTDLTAVKLLEEQLHLKESLAAVGELTAGIAHEFRNGLATIHGYGKLLDLKAVPENYRPYVAGIQAETQSLAEMVTNFLNFAKPAQLTLSQVALRGVCERAAEDVRAEARSLGGDVTMTGEFGCVEGDEVLLRQAFSNLLRNAVEACVGASRVPVVSVVAVQDAAQRTSIITINDNGPGIPPEARERIFQPFFTTKRSGTGLGLALVQKIIVFHNGRVGVSTSDLGGASLEVTLPDTPIEPT